MANEVQIEPAKYATVAASQAAQALGGAAGKLGDYLSHIQIVPASTSPGAVTLLDGATSMVLFEGGANSVTTLAPFGIGFGANSKAGRWAITTGANVSAVAFGRFG